MTRRLLAAVGIVCLLPGEAAAHLVSTRFGELYSGMLHPLTAMQHLVPWLALALLGGLQDSRTARWALAAFPISVWGGVTLADLGVNLPFTEMLNILSFVALGLLVVLKVRLDIRLFLAIVVVSGISHGHANGAPELAGGDALLYATGVALTAYLLVTLISASAHALVGYRGWGNIAVRAVGSWIAAAGLIYGGFLLTLS
jgi:hydrogenase/urease accessory protein HupE